MCSDAQCKMKLFLLILSYVFVCVFVCVICFDLCVCVCASHSPAASSCCFCCVSLRLVHHHASRCFALPRHRWTSSAERCLWGLPANNGLALWSLQHMSICHLDPAGDLHIYVHTQRASPLAGHTRGGEETRVSWMLAAFM